MAPMVNTKLIEAVEAEWRAIGRQADAKRRAIGDCGQPARRAAPPPFIRSDTSTDTMIRTWGKAARERMRRAVNGD